MRGRVMRADRKAPAVIHFELQRGAELELAALHCADVNEEIAELFLRIGDAELDAALAGQYAGVADLAAGLRVERRLVQHDRAGVAGLEARGFLAVLYHRRPPPL